MATVPISAKSGWVEVSAASCDFQNDSLFNLRYAFSAVAPDTNSKGFSITAGEIRGVNLLGGLKLFFKNDNDTGVNIEVASWV